MKRRFGTLITRLLWGGTTLTKLECLVVEAMIENLPEWLGKTVRSQIEGYNLVQREHDGRTLNFYRKLGGRPNNMEGLPLLNMNCEDAKLVGVTFRFADIDAKIDATITAIRGRMFCVSFDRALRTIKTKAPPIAEHVRHSWRSHFPEPQSQNNPMERSGGSAAS
jgi:hypothetical protein